MLFVGIDQHKRHLTICVRDEQGGIALRRQVSTKWEEVDRFLVSLRERAAEHGGYVAVMEVCGFNGWPCRRRGVRKLRLCEFTGDAFTHNPRRRVTHCRSSPSSCGLLGSTMTNLGGGIRVPSRRPYETCCLESNQDY